MGASLFPPPSTTAAANGYKLVPADDCAESDEERERRSSTSSNATFNRSETLKKVFSAMFYGLSSVLIVFVNKILLTNFKFPSFLLVGIGQMAVTIVLLSTAKVLGFVNYPHLDRTISRRIFPLPIFYAFNLVSGLGGTQKTNLPMFTVLRRFSIFMTMILEYLVLGTRPTFAVKVSVFLMIFGSFIAAIYDLSFDAYGYALIFINNICTAANGVLVKKKLEAKDLGKYGVLYYNSLFMILPTILAAYFLTDDIDKLVDFVGETGLTIPVITCFLLSCMCGFILNYSLVLCSTFNSALTTTCVGPIKNLIVTYAGMVSSGDYVFQWANFVGVNISVFGSVVYTYVTFRRPASSNVPKKTANRRNRQVTVFPKKKKEDNERLLHV